MFISTTISLSLSSETETTQQGLRTRKAPVHTGRL